MLARPASDVRQLGDLIRRFWISVPFKLAKEHSLTTAGLPRVHINRLLMTEAPVPSLYGFEGIFSAMLQISRFVVSDELDDTRP
jgi:hypothetical protein